MLKFKKLHPDAKLPVYASEGAACFDFSAIVKCDTWNVPAGQAWTFNTGLAVEVPPGFVMLIFSRSGHGFKDGVRLANCVGVIDSDYRGEIKIKLQSDAKSLIVANGDRIAQGMILPILQETIIEANELSETVRGEGGFGSTGSNAISNDDYLKAALMGKTAKEINEQAFKGPIAQATSKTIKEINDERFKQRIDTVLKKI